MNRIDCRRRTQLAQHRNHRMANAVARIIVCLVGAVCAPALVILCKICFNLSAFAFDQRTNNASAHGRDAGQAGGSAAARQMKNHSFQIVVRRMRGCNAHCAELPRRTLKKRIPRLARRGFQRYM